MPKRKDVVVEQLEDLVEDLEDLWRALTRDPKAEARKERLWTIVSGVAGAASTMASRKLLAKLWPILTGERPPTRAPAAPQQETEPTESADEAREPAGMTSR
jgi:hypothetical protein